MKIGLLGLGKMGANHARLLSEESTVDFVGFYDPVVLEPEAQGKRYGNDSELIETCDALVIASPSSMHADIAEKVLQAGKHCLIEKPLATSENEISRIKEASRNGSGKAYVGMVERFNPAVSKGKQFLREQGIGQVIQISTVRQGPRPQRIKDVGVDLDLAVHDLDLSVYLGESEIYSMHSITAKVETESAFPDFFKSLGKLSNGVLFSNTVNWHHPLKERSIAIHGTEAVLELDLLNMQVKLAEFGSADFSWPSLNQTFGASKGRIRELELELQEPLKLEIQSFIRAISGDDGNEDICSVDEAASVLRWIL